MTEVRQPGQSDSPSRLREDRVVYLLPQESDFDVGASLDPREILQELWRGRTTILIVTFAVGFIGIAYAMLATPWYRAEVVMVPTQMDMGQGLAAQISQLAPLASLAGIAVGSDNTAESLSVLQSRTLSRDFIESQGLLPVLFSDRWDEIGKKWKVSSQRTPDIRDGVEYFDKDIRRVFQDRKTGVVRLTIEWTDPELASTWANGLAQRLNKKMRERALADAQKNVKFLQNELAATNVVALQQPIGRLLESELQKLMLARGSEEFSYRVIDAAEVPKKRVRPRRAIIAIGALLVGGILGASIVMLRRRRRVDFGK